MQVWPIPCGCAIFDTRPHAELIDDMQRCAALLAVTCLCMQRLKGLRTPPLQYVRPPFDKAKKYVGGSIRCVAFPVTELPREARQLGAARLSLPLLSDPPLKFFTNRALVECYKMGHFYSYPIHAADFVLKKSISKPVILFSVTNNYVQTRLNATAIIHCRKHLA
jgi:hypothetical protein